MSEASDANLHWRNEDGSTALQSSLKKRKFDNTDVDADEDDSNNRSKQMKPFGTERVDDEYHLHESHGIKRPFTPKEEPICPNDRAGHEDDEWEADLEYIQEIDYDDEDKTEDERAEGGDVDHADHHFEDKDGEEEEERKEEEEDEDEEAAGSTTPTYTPKSSATFSREDVSATVTGTSPAPAAAMAIKAGASALPCSPTKTTGLSYAAGGAQARDGCPHGSNSMSQPTANLGVSTHPKPTVRCVATSFNGAETPTSYQPRKASFPNTTSYKLENILFTSETRYVNNWTPINKTTGGNTPTSWQPLQDSFTRAHHHPPGDGGRGNGYVPRNRGTFVPKAKSLLPGRKFPRTALSAEVSPTVGDAIGRGTTFGKVLEMVKQEKDAEHLEIEEEITALQQQIDILREQSKAAKSQSDKARVFFESAAGARRVGRFEPV
ncbi:hypothetical protein BJY00DRAFT_315569 [Aspergillus carlsbadensis]|nr:hypothetical protein BJY00DRAFT_315569 [Aspergillus carlsbadensis]